MNDLADIKGVGAATLEKFAALGINCVRDLLLFLPSSYTDLGAPVPLRDAEDGEFALLEGEVLSVTEPQKRGKKSFTLRLRDTLDPKGMFFIVTYFNQPYYRAQFETGKVYRFFGKIKSGSPALVNPVFDRADGDKLQGIYTTYPLKGLIGRNAFVKIMREALYSMPEYDLSKTFGMWTALHCIHFPDLYGLADKYAFLLAAWDLAAGFYTYRKALSRFDDRRKRKYTALPATAVEDFTGLLDITPTESQRAAFADIYADINDWRRMSRIVSGDVGSGKTLVAFFAAYAAAKSGRQCAFMAPTEILAAQHARKFAPIARKAGINFALLTSSTPKEEAEDILEKLARGKLSVVFGTQSLLAARVRFRDLALAVIDEQHKFGVAERAELQNKGAEDVLALTATPIPRSLAIALYKGISVSRIKKREEATTNISTFTVPDAKLDGLVDYVAKECKSGKQAFIVCSSIRDSEGFETLSVESFSKKYADRLEGVSCAVLHGRMTPERKREVMSAFSRGEISLLIATSVVEVGVDTRASVMCVLAADRFGLASLHQLRGRVGRDGSPACCFLHVKNPTEQAMRRLGVLVKEVDGEAIADHDLRLRGVGELLGVRQSGLARTPCLGLPLTADVINHAFCVSEEESRRAAEFFSETSAGARLAEFAERAMHITFDS